jgi:hypothetical protein
MAFTTCHTFDSDIEMAMQANVLLFGGVDSILHPFLIVPI